MRFTSLSDAQILKELTSRLRQRRLNLNMTQEQVAERSGLHIQTIKNLESGRNASLQTVIQILRVYGDLEGLDQFLPDPGLSPIQLLQLKGKERERASGNTSEGTAESNW
ncbi:Helix-turn-helix [Robiginitalea myxolifaciens]|uniref:Helix-turn-helix n=1 Tax=Robiginitalea myxolifaciens TaxID=400055 RepID=A0A1I6FVS9_9FLAO|nr:helix-turn-helix transcriptional regulator [Robiginitalea myxolifaciens]SFR34062.1 Helix-turn-helix [Robiginitalea myxolifaciens]